MIIYKHEVGTKWYEREFGTDTRSCLRCQTEFVSESIDNRICPNCKGSDEWKHSEQGLGHNDKEGKVNGINYSFSYVFRGFVCS